MTKILIVDDNNLNLRLLTEILEDEGYEIRPVNEALKAIEAAKEFKPEIILLDIMMPDIDGFQLCKNMKSDFDLKDIPIIMVTAKTEGTDIKKALELGAFDYVKKPVDEIEVIARVQSALRYKKNQDKLKDMAMKDGLTGLYNHALLVELFDKEFLKQSRAGSNICFAMIDIDYFKKINDTYGHTIGDVILMELSDILMDSVRKSDVVGRYGGEEFGIIIPDISKNDSFQLCERIRHAVEKYNFNKEDKAIRITISIGICFKGFGDDISYLDMIKKADEMLYRAKGNGRNRVEID